LSRAGLAFALRLRLNLILWEAQEIFIMPISGIAALAAKMSKDEARLRTALEAIKAKIIAGEITDHGGAPGAPLYFDEQTLLTDFIDRALAPVAHWDMPARPRRLNQNR
jgi:hypothetical protein